MICRCPTNRAWDVLQMKIGASVVIQSWPRKRPYVWQSWQYYGTASAIVLPASSVSAFTGFSLRVLWAAALSLFASSRRPLFANAATRSPTTSPLRVPYAIHRSSEYSAVGRNVETLSLTNFVIIFA